MMTRRSVTQIVTRSSRLFGLAVTLLCLASCGDLTVISVAPADRGLPAAVKGEWQGTWASGESGPSGVLILRIQEFNEEPVVAVTIDNACLSAQNYQLVLFGESVTLEVGGIPILVAELTSSGELVGSYDCPQDSGTWSATRIGSLPDPIDLSGTWLGSAVTAGEIENPLLVQLDQFVRDGRIEFKGFAYLHPLVPDQIPLAGFVNFRAADFELVLHTVAGVEPSMVFAGIGSADPVQVEFGMIQVLGPQAASFSQAVFQILQQQN